MDEYKDYPDDVLEKMTIDDINPTPTVLDVLALDANDISYLKEECLIDSSSAFSYDDITSTSNIFDALALDADDMSYLKKEGLLDSLSAFSNRERDHYRKRNLSSWI